MVLEFLYLWYMLTLKNLLAINRIDYYYCDSFGPKRILNRRNNDIKINQSPLAEELKNYCVIATCL